ncbi:DUF6338 family protein [Mariniblastus sp.]|nr:DUF6338 family protein [Mariniblastus sp.]
MISISEDVVALIYHLLPGFVTAWIFYGLTSHPKSSSFERVVQALIFTALIQAVVIPTGVVFQWLGQWYSFGVWDESIKFLCSIVVAILIGHLFAWGANSNWYHRILNTLGITSRTSRPNSWFSAFHNRQRYIVLHLKNGRRLQGWPNEWPDDPAKGHFLMEKPAWILDDNTVQKLWTDEAIVIDAADVEMVEILRTVEEIQGKEDEITEIKQQLIAYNKRSNDDRTESSGTEDTES